MPPKLALFFGAVFIYFVYRSEKKRGVQVSKALFWPSLWYLVVASRPIGYWFSLWGIPLPGGSDDPTEGSAIDRYFFAALTVIGFVILARRRFDWGGTLRRNPWVTVLIVYMALSILWSQYSFVSFKRFVKVIGSIVMALVVLTEEQPLTALFSVLRRCLFIHLPMSIICTRYFRDIGVSYTYSGEGQSWQGISTSKNTLGQIAMLGVICFAWGLREHWKQDRWKSFYALYLLMAVYLLKGAGDSVSMTSISVSALALFIFIRIQTLRARPHAIRGFVWKLFLAKVTLITLVITHSLVMFSADSVFGKMITTFGRDITLTDRTNIWHDVYASCTNPILGVGFGGFWIGRLANIPWAANLTWVLGQGHSGYVDSYLQLGLVGICILAATLFGAVPRLLASLREDFDFACFRITLLLTTVYVNITESTFLRGDHHLWFITMIVLWMLPHRERFEEEPEDTEQPEPVSR